MAIPTVSPSAPVGAAPSITGSKQSFSQTLESSGAAEGSLKAAGTAKAAPANPAVAQAGCVQVSATNRVAGAQKAVAPEAAKLVDRVTAAQHRLDQVMRLAESGKSFTPAELLAFQSHVYRASQELDLAGKVVEKATAGIKQVLQTQL